eukprot:COSAG05_NODE_1746_length_4154_cov_2.325031_3_plen_115_part_00
MSADELQLFGQTIRQQIKLKHLEALWTLLQSLTNVDVFAKVQTQYTALLTPELTALITASAPALELDILLPTFKDFILAQLTVSSLSFFAPCSRNTHTVPLRPLFYVHVSVWLH